MFEKVLSQEQEGERQATDSHQAVQFEVILDGAPEGIEERPSALHAAFAAALFITSVAAFLRFLFVAFNDVLDIMNVYTTCTNVVFIDLFTVMIE